jgi:hypothetical protein
MGMKKLSYPVDSRNVPSKKIPLFFGGTKVYGPKETRTPDGKVLIEERYEIVL